jgi:hypothetical protein
MSQNAYKANRSGMPEIFSSDYLVQGPAERIESSDEVGGLRGKMYRREVSFGNPLKDAIALSYGTTDDGELDLRQFESISSLGEYLQDRHGQPFLIADTLWLEGRHVRTDIAAGVLADLPQPVGVRISDRVGFKTSYGIDDADAGIAVEGKAYGIELEKFHNTPLRLRRAVVMNEGVMPFNLPGMFIRVGKPHEGGQVDPATIKSKQVVVAGEDILPWIQNEFEKNEQYDVFLGLLNALRNTGTEQYLAAADFLRQLAHDRQVLSLAQAALLKAQKAVREERGGFGIRSTFNIEALRIRQMAGTLLKRHRLEMLEELPSFSPTFLDGRLNRVNSDLNQDYHPGSLDISKR